MQIEHRNFYLYGRYGYYLRETKLLMLQAMSTNQK